MYLLVFISFNQINGSLDYLWHINLTIFIFLNNLLKYRTEKLNENKHNQPPY